MSSDNGQNWFPVNGGEWKSKMAHIEESRSALFSFSYNNGKTSIYNVAYFNGLYNVQELGLDLKAITTRYVPPQSFNNINTLIRQIENGQELQGDGMYPSHQLNPSKSKQPFQQQGSFQIGGGSSNKTGLDSDSDSD